MDSEGDVVESHRSLRGKRVPRSILLANQGRKEEARGIDGVANEAQDVVGRIVDRGSVGRASFPVEERLRIEGD
jgi:hypothetical protein